MSRDGLLQLLEKEDLRTTGNSAMVVRKVQRSPELFPQLVSLMSHDDKRVRARAADAAEKITRTSPELLREQKQRLFALSKCDQQEVQWHVAPMLTRLPLTPAEAIAAERILKGYLENSTSKIVRVAALQGLADLALQGKIDKRKTAGVIEVAVARFPAPSMRARATLLLRLLG